MWIALNDGFLSIVKPKPFDVPKPERQRAGRGWQHSLLMVRARRAAHLKAVFPRRKVYQFKGRDYPCRVFIGRAEVADLIAERVADIDYTNFKDSVRNGELHDAYMGVWSVMHRYQHGEYRPQPVDEMRLYGVTSRRQAERQRDFAFAYGRGDLRGPPFSPIHDADDHGQPVDPEFAEVDETPEQWFAGARVRLPDDEVCGKLGCTPDHPCMDCLTRALAHENERQLGAEPDRYGDFDEDSDINARSHLRAPPK